MKLVPGITQLHGKPKMLDFHGLKIKLIPLFHPAAIIYNRSLLELWEKDMEIVKEEIKSNNEIPSNSFGNEIKQKTLI